MHEAITLRFPIGIRGDFARQNVPKQAERVVESFVVDGGVEVLHLCSQGSYSADDASSYKLLVK